MPIVAFAVSILLMIPFLAWGVHTLRERYVRHEEIPPHTEILSLAGVAVFLTCELVLLRVWMGSIGVFYAFTALALVAASTALYGPIFVSAASRAAVSFVHPPHQHEVQEPRFHPAEALEAQGDHDGALREYMVMARIFPKDSETALRVAHVLCELERFEEAVVSFERGLRLATDPERAVLATNRLADLYRDRLDRTGEAVRVLTTYLERFAGSTHAELVQRRLDRLTRATTTPTTNGAAESL
jgi:tetratricopeptide (TPR) repeat protein